MAPSSVLKNDLAFDDNAIRRFIGLIAWLLPVVVASKPRGLRDPSDKLE